VHNCLPDLATLLVFLLNFAIFLVPGFAVAMATSVRREISPVQSIILLLVTSATLGYLAFWIYFESKQVGRIFSFASVVIGAIILILALIRSPRPRVLARTLAVPLGCTAVVGICYISLFYLFSDPLRSGADLGARRFFTGLRPGDNLVPLIFARKIYEGEPLKPFCCGDWLSSDRPPLQAGMFLFQLPFKIYGGVDFNYQLLSTALQCFWVCGVWALLNSLRTPALRVKQVLGFLIFSDFLFYNSVYVWPKLLAATFTLFVIAIFFESWISDRRFTYLQIALASGSFSLAIMAHPGSIFSFPVFLFLLISKRKLLGVRQCALAGVLTAFFVLPWMAYRKFYDPPGNRLLKMHFAAISTIDSRSTWQTIKDAYRERDLVTILRLKRSNLYTLIGPKLFDGLGLTAISVSPWRLNQRAAEATRIAQREYIWNAVGVLNVGWLAALISFTRKTRTKSPLPHGALLLIAAVINLIVWALIIFGPSQTVTTHSSYADILLLSIGLLGILLTLPRFAILSLFLMQIFNFFVVWVFARPYPLGSPQPAAIGAGLQLPFLVVGAGCAMAFAWHFGRSYIERVPPLGNQGLEV
jgi:hypothetical protein